MDAFPARWLGQLPLHLHLIMKQTRYGGSPVPLPDLPSGIGGLSAFARQVRDAIRVLRDRPVLSAPRPQRLQPPHPWKVTANGDDTVTIANGSVIYFTAQGSASVPNSPFDGAKVDYTSEDVTITATGTLYAVVTTAGVSFDEIISFESTSGVGAQALTPSSVTVELDPTLTGDKISIPLATVTLTDGVATVDTQILTYNPILDLVYVDVAAP